MASTAAAPVPRNSHSKRIPAHDERQDSEHVGDREDHPEHEIRLCRQLHSLTVDRSRGDRRLGRRAVEDVARHHCAGLDGQALNAQVNVPSDRTGDRRVEEPTADVSCHLPSIVSVPPNMMRSRPTSARRPDLDPETGHEYVVRNRALDHDLRGHRTQ